MTHPITRFIARPSLGLAVVATLWLAQPTAVQASGVIQPKVDMDTAAGTVMLVSSAIGFGAVDLLYFAHDRPMPIGLTVVQILVGGVLVPLSAMRSNDQGVVIGAAISSAWFTGHGIYSGAACAERKRERDRALAADRAWSAACAREPEPRSLLCSRSR